MVRPWATTGGAGKVAEGRLSRLAVRVRVDVPSHRDVVALAGHLAAQGWRVRRRRRHLFVGAD